MKTIKINESQRQRLFEAYQEGFSLECLSMIGRGQFAGEDNSKTQYAYCCKYLGEPDAKGTSRCVFTLNDSLVLKLAYGRADVGVEQNHSEANLFRTAKSPLLVKIYACDDYNYTWLVSEAVLPAKEIDFEKIFGIPFDSLYRQHSVKMRKSALPNKGDIDIGFNKYFNDIKDYGETKSDGVTISAILEYITDKYIRPSMFINPTIGNIINGGWLQEGLKEWVNELIRLVKAGKVADITKLENYGIVNRDGKPQIVLLDSGATMNLLKKYYQR